MSDSYEILDGVPMPPPGKPKTGMTDTLRRMKHGQCVVIPFSKKASMYACAAQAGIKIRIQSNPDDQKATVWRVDEGSEVETGAVPPPSDFWDQLLTPEGEFPSGEYRQDHPFGPRVWHADHDAQGRPVNLTKKPAPLKTVFD